MKLRHTQRRELDINLTPLIDVVFLLLIFFMVSTTFKRESEISIELPQATAEEKKPMEDPIEITIDASGRFYVNQQEVVNTQVETLKRALRKVAGDRKDPPLIINADARTPHQSVVTVMDAARQLGFIHLTFPTQKPPGDS